MHRRTLTLAVLLTLSLALPVMASQFVRLPFDQVARDSALIVRGTIENTWSAWDDSHEVIFTYATVRVSRYFGEATGPDRIVVREAGGVVDGYAQEAIGFPAIRRGEDVVLLLSRWEDGNDYRIHAYNQGKYLVRNRDGVEVLVEDPVKQGEARLERPEKLRANAVEDEGPALTIDEFAEMIVAARAGERERIHDRTRQ